MYVNHGISSLPLRRCQSLLSFYPWFKSRRHDSLRTSVPQIACISFLMVMVEASRSIEPLYTYFVSNTDLVCA